MLMIEDHVKIIFLAC